MTPEDVYQQFIAMNVACEQHRYEEALDLLYQVAEATGEKGISPAPGRDGLGAAYRQGWTDSIWMYYFVRGFRGSVQQEIQRFLLEGPGDNLATRLYMFIEEYSATGRRTTSLGMHEAREVGRKLQAIAGNTEVALQGGRVAMRDVDAIVTGAHKLKELGMNLDRVVADQQQKTSETAPPVQPWWKNDE